MTAKSVSISKWIHGPEAGTAASDAARMSIGQRLDAVLDFLPLAARHADDDLEYVHQLRVATRRAEAAFEVYADMLPQRRARELKRDLKRIRKAAGDARDLDVMILRFEQDPEGARRKQTDRLLQDLKERRLGCQNRIEEVCKRMRWSWFEKRSRRLLKRVRWRKGRAEPGFTEVAAETVELAATRFLVSFDSQTEDVAVLHEMRVEAKRLRYTLELAEPAFGRRLRKGVYRQVAELQESLGSISDHEAARTLFLHWAPQSGVGKLLKRLAKAELKAIAESIVRFRRDWPDERLLKLEQQLKSLVENCEE